MSGFDHGGRVRDLTHFAQWTIADTTVATLAGKAVALPKAAGTTGVSATYGGLNAVGTLVVKATAIPAAAAAPPAPSGPTWTTDIFPLFQTTLMCKNCHGPAGFGRLHLTGVSATERISAPGSVPW